MSAAYPAAPRNQTHKESVNANTLTGKLVMGYQGWFTCPNDHPGGDWGHWFAKNYPTVDMLPDVAELPSDSLCPTDLVSADGSRIQVYSSASRAVINTHFHWMEKYGLDGVAIQRFATMLPHAGLVDRADSILSSVQQSAEKYGRVFFVMYDLSGMQSENLLTVQRDWQHLQEMGITRSKSYLHHRGHPLVGIWGLGFASRLLKPQDVKTLLLALRDSSEMYGGITVLGGVPGSWRLGTGDTAAGWAEIWPMLGVISPWTVGRYVNSETMTRYRRDFTAPDIAEARRIGVDYMPVIFPGFSWVNLMHLRQGESTTATLNQIPRNCGRFYWEQFTSAMRLGVSMIYGGMFDEVDEGTAMYKVLSRANQVPGTGTAAGESFLTLDADGCHLPSDWYLRIAGAATKHLYEKKIPLDILPFPLP